MDDNQPKKGGLSEHFNVKSIVKHIFSPTMITMMAIMAFPAAAAIPPDAVTLTDIGAATVDHFKTMFTAPFTDGGVVVDATKNAIQGDWSLNYEFGEAHAGHGAVMGHSPTMSPSEHLEIKESIANEIADDADFWGEDTESYISNMERHP